MQYYANPNDPDDAVNVARFSRVVNDYPQLDLYQPAPDKAPWHVQAIIDGPNPQLLNFWPHRLKGQRDGYKAVKGELALRGIIDGALEDVHDAPYDVIEE